MTHHFLAFSYPAHFLVTRFPLISFQTEDDLLVLLFSSAGIYNAFTVSEIVPRLRESETTL